MMMIHSTGSPTRTSRRGFTMLETVLALVLSSMVVLGCLALFGVLDRSEERQSIRMEESLELANAHKVISRVCNTFLMSEDTPRDERQLKARLAEDDARNAPERAAERDPEAETARVALQPDIDRPGVMEVSTDRGTRRAPVQTFMVTVRDSPVLGGEEKTEEQKSLEEFRRQEILDRALSRTDGRSRETTRSERRRERDSRRGTSGMDSGRSGEGRIGMRDRTSDRRDAESALAEALAGAGGAGGAGGERDRDELTASERLEEDSLNEIRAPGVRGVFEILPDGQTPGGDTFSEGANVRPVRLSDDGSPLYSLWWRELPPVGDVDPTLEDELLAGDDDNGRDSRLSRRERERELDRRQSERENDLSLLAESQLSDSSGKRVLLLSGLKTCHWTVLRGRKPRDKITATERGELPAYVELEFVTASGRRENWMFEVGWTTGPEPGSIIPAGYDPLNAANQPVNPGDPNDPNNPGGDPNNPNQPGDPNKPGDPGNKPGIVPKPGPGQGPANPNFTPRDRLPQEKPARWDNKPLR